MKKDLKKKKLSLIMRVKEMIDPLVVKLDTIDSKIKAKGYDSRPAYYRNEDLKNIFGLSPNTIIKYRQTGILPYSKLGEIFLYDSMLIEKILQENQS
ncbi:helix-turn-helix domain-containing protein [Flavobacterium sp. SORGH_AS_0622]|uniref:helix-turn-helix domain-containing protein n=1 Tax=Flavobacterium sp. SORGH_AS_0622 TaxID=3041772 RepID=UPI00278B1BF2|nr:helix-turn-helix domain-containing protein [Flavobacterium sp. SORGH_AS_0622]MDQ1164683.1 hypothetical protein [Flavobacterium sp. SORGH_AS_0622]